MRDMSRFVRFGAVAAALWVAAPASAQKTYKDPRYGFQLLIPKDFREIPINMAEKWVVAKFQYKRPLEPKDSQYWVEMAPEIKVIIFPNFSVKDVVAARKNKEKLKVKGKDGRTKTVALFEYLKNPFRNYHEYLQENYKKGGWFVAKETKCTVAGMPAVKKIIDAEDKMRTGVKLALTAWEINYGDATYVVQFDCLKDHDHRFRASVGKAIKRYKKVDRTQPLRSALTTGSSASEEDKKDAVARAKEKTLSPAERRKARDKDLARAVAKAKEGLTSGWKTYQEGPFTVFYSSSPRFAKMVSKQAVLVWKWMEKHFDYIGQDASVGSILRICKTKAEGKSYQETSSRSDLTLTRREIVVWDDKDWNWNDINIASHNLNTTIAANYLNDKNVRLWYAMPPWLDQGLRFYIGTLRAKNGKLQARPDEWDMDGLRKRLREDKFKPSSELIQAHYGGSFNSSSYASADRMQSFAILSFLLGRGSKMKKYKRVLPTYLAHLDKRIRALDEEWKKRKGVKATEEELTKWALDFRKRSRKIFEECLEQTFGSWSKTDWRNFDNAWRKAAR